MRTEMISGAGQMKEIICVGFPSKYCDLIHMCSRHHDRISKRGYSVECRQEGVHRSTWDSWRQCFRQAKVTRKERRGPREWTRRKKGKLYTESIPFHLLKCFLKERICVSKSNVKLVRRWFFLSFIQQLNQKAALFFRPFQNGRSTSYFCVLCTHFRCSSLRDPRT